MSDVQSNESVPNLEEARRRIREAADSGSPDLHLNDLGLTSDALAELLPEIGALAELRFLDLDKNQLTELPPEIGALTALRQLFLESNQLTELPREIRSLTALIYLELATINLPRCRPRSGL